jgi:hypothetical protein
MQQQRLRPASLSRTYARSRIPAMMTRCRAAAATATGRRPTSLPSAFFPGLPAFTVLTVLLLLLLLSLAPSFTLCANPFDRPAAAPAAGSPLAAPPRYAASALPAGDPMADAGIDERRIALQAAVRKLKTHKMGERRRGQAEENQKEKNKRRQKQKKAEA